MGGAFGVAFWPVRTKKATPKAPPVERNSLLGGFGVIQRGPKGRKGLKPRFADGSPVSRVVRRAGVLGDQLGKDLTDGWRPSAACGVEWFNPRQTARRGPKPLMFG